MHTDLSPITRSATDLSPGSTCATTMPLGRSGIDLATALQACEVLAISQTELLTLVNTAQLPAYRIGDLIRFRYRDVESLASRRAIAA